MSSYLLRSKEAGISLINLWKLVRLPRGALFSGENVAYRFLSSIFRPYSKFSEDILGFAKLRLR